MPGRCNTAAAATGNASALPPGAVPDSTGSGRKRGRNGPGLQPVERNPSAIECLSMPGSGADPAQIGRGLPASEAGRRVCSRAYGVCPGAYRQQKSSTYRALGVCSGACTRPSQPRRRQAPQVPVRARQSAYARTRKPAASGVTNQTPNWSNGRSGQSHHHGRNIVPCRTKGVCTALLPPRLLSRTVGPLHLGAFRVAVANRGNKIVSRVQSIGGILHTWRTGADAVTAAHRRPRHGPHRSGGSRTCSRSAGTGRAFASDEGDGSS